MRMRVGVFEEAIHQFGQIPRRRGVPDVVAQRIQPFAPLGLGDDVEVASAAPAAVACG